MQINSLLRSELITLYVEARFIPYYMKFLQYVYFVILRCAYFATLKFRNFAKILYFESL